MAVQGYGGSVVVTNPSGTAMVVTITETGGAVPTVYTTEARATAHSMPLTITDDTSFFLPYPGTFTVSVTSNGDEIATAAGDAVVAVVGDGQTLTVSPSPSDTAVLGLLAENKVDLVSGDTASRPAADEVAAGYMYFDTDLGLPIWSDGAAWVDATGADPDL